MRSKETTFSWVSDFLQLTSVHKHTNLLFFFRLGKFFRRTCCLNGDDVVSWDADFGAKQGHDLHIVIEGDQEEECAAALEAFLKENL
jgi:hypothetical protein